MRITELFTAKSIALDVAAKNQAEIIDRLVELQATHGNITDTEAYKKALYAREAEASTYVDNGITVPHAKTSCVTRPSLAALRLTEPVQYNAEDDGKTDLLFAIAAPENGSLHVDMLARMMQMLMNEDFVEKLRAAKTPAEFLDAIDAQEDAQFGEESFTNQNIPQSGYRILAVTACPNGIAHTYMAAVMVGGMVPPIAIALSTTFCPKKWTPDERRNGIVNYVMGLCFVTEGAIPYAAADPLRVLPSCVIGAALSGALSMTFGCALRAPHGGIFVFLVVDHAVMYVVALAAGSIVGAVILSLLKKNKTEA